MAVVASLVGGVVLAGIAGVIGLLIGGDKVGEYAGIGGMMVGFFVGRGVYEKIKGGGDRSE